MRNNPNLRSINDSAHDWSVRYLFTLIGYCKILIDYNISAWQSDDWFIDLTNHSMKSTIHCFLIGHFKMQANCSQTIKLNDYRFKESEQDIYTQLPTDSIWKEKWHIYSIGWFLFCFWWVSITETMDIKNNIRSIKCNITQSFVNYYSVFNRISFIFNCFIFTSSIISSNYFDFLLGEASSGFLLFRLGFLSSSFYCFISSLISRNINWTLSWMKHC